ncbi:jerky protein homolog-like [Parasteatoda tepidariorum]|uniref:jerky protein homolog-like n=1 Tax=Parasteatoda tepidariorum TaxID=114398 RepID=UPI0039BCB81E
MTNGISPIVVVLKEWIPPPENALGLLIGKINYAAHWNFKKNIQHCSQFAKIAGAAYDICQIKTFESYSEVFGIILLLDNCKAHPPVDESVSGNIVATLLPPDVTFLIQPMDQGVIQNFKCFYRRSCIQGLLNADCDVTDFQKKFTVKDVLYAIALSWNQVKNTTLQKCWRKLWPAANLASDLTLQTDKEEDPLTKVLDVVRSADNPLKNLPEDEVGEWLPIAENEPVEQELTDEDIINIVVNPQPTQNLEESDSDAETEEKIS